MVPVVTEVRTDVIMIDIMIMIYRSSWSFDILIDVSDHYYFQLHLVRVQICMHVHIRARTRVNTNAAGPPRAPRTPPPSPLRNPQCGLQLLPHLQQLLLLRLRHGVDVC